MPTPFMATQMRTMAAPSDNFLSGSNANYIDYMYSQWQKDPSSVHASWNAYFSGGDSSFQTPPTLGQSASGSADINAILAALKSGGRGMAA
jgi:2-oxoglutarate dehydrogenase E1 component|mmetsp:Transcript_20368/g.27548  ORF Transcript_20368/g.27548 Transcript_20368/m.27548 type:complete len:91 (+) Transcript_20368:93-365(+)